jgi:uncharacterized protein (DUF433 family)
MRNKHRNIEEPCDGKLSSTVLKTSGIGDSLAEFNQVVKFTRITVDPRQMAGVPCIRSLRITVATVVSMIAKGMAEPEILTAYPDLESADIKESLFYAAQLSLM